MYTPNLIIGAGPAGLAMAGRFKNTGLPFEILEQSQNPGNTWRHHYDRLHLHTVKQLSSLPHLDFPEDYPTYVPRKKMVEYFESYVYKFGIKPKYNQEVISVDRENNAWKVSTKSGDEILADNVIIATGVNRIRTSPTLPGQEKYKGEIIHSRVYKNPHPYRDKKVLVVGMGNTGAEIALDLSEKDVTSHLSVRGEIGLIPRDVNGQPVQLTAKKLAKLPFGFGDWLGTQIRKMIIGDMSKYGLKISKMHPAVQLTKTGKTPVIDIGTAQAIKDGKIKVHPAIKQITSQGVIFEDNTEEDFDAIILATGYKANIQDYLKHTDGLLDRRELPKEKIGLNERDGLYFLGYDNYKLGGIFGTIKDDSLLVLKHIAEK